MSEIQDAAKARDEMIKTIQQMVFDFNDKFNPMKISGIEVNSTRREYGNKHVAMSYDFNISVIV